MTAPVGSIKVFDGVAALAGVGGPRRLPPLGEAVPASRAAPRVDRVELSPDARQRPAAGTDLRLIEDEKRVLEALKRRDREVRAHEQAHKAAAGPHAGPIAYSFTTGPDGRRYATAGEVPIDVAPVEGDPEATISKMQQVRRAALAPGEPSASDRRVAAEAMKQQRAARAELGAGSGRGAGRLDVIA